MLYDKDIREPLFEYLETRFPIHRIYEEKMIGNSRADAVLVTPDALYGIEIKSDADTYARLQRQTKDYDKYYDYNIIVCGGSHGNHIREHVPEHWGIITVDEVDGKCDFYYYREPLPNPHTSIANKLSILWRPELASIQEKLGLPKYNHFGKAKLIQKIKDMATEAEYQPLICDTLLNRDYTTIAETISAYRKEKNLKKRRYTKKLGVKRKRRSGL